MLDRILHVDAAVPFFFPAMEEAVAVPELAVAMHAERRIDARALRRDRRDHLEGRTRRIDAAERFVQERLVGAFIQLAPQIGWNAFGEDVRIEGRRRGEHKNVAGFDVDDDGRCAFALKRLHRRELKIRVDRQPERFALRRLFDAVFNFFDHASMRVDLDIHRPGNAAKLFLIGALKPVPADFETGLAQQELLVFIFRRFKIPFSDGADITDHEGGRIPERVIPRLAHFRVGAGKMRQLVINFREVIPAEIIDDLDRRVALRTLDFAQQLCVFVIRDHDKFTDAVERRFNVARFVGHQQKSEILAVRRQYFSKPVDDLAAQRRDDAGVELIFLRKALVFFVVEHLQLKQPRADAGEQQAETAAKYRCAAGDDFLLFRIVRIDAHRYTSITTRRWRLPKTIAKTG